MDQIAETLSQFRFDIESSNVSARSRRETARKQQNGIRIVKWLRQLEGLDEEHVLPKQFCSDLGWLLVAEGNEEAMISWFVEEGERWIKSKYFVKITKASTKESGVYSVRAR